MNQENRVVKLKLVELEHDNFHLIAPSTLANGEEAWWIVDTGASKTVFDSELSSFYEEMELPEEEELAYNSAGINAEIMPTKMGRLSMVQLGSLKAEELSVALLPLAHIREIYAQFCSARIVGLLGSDLLWQYGATIDYQQLELRWAAT